MYLTAKSVPKTSLLDQWNGRTGRFVRTFGMNTKRNKNEWRATWDSIKKNIHTAINYPGIEFEECVNAKCDLNHVEADTFEENVEKQKPFAKTNIIDYVIDENEKSVDLIHEVLDDKFWKRLNKEELYVSPMIWPVDGGVKVLGRGRDGLPVIDADNWKFVHHAFLTRDPAYGTDTATVKTTCEGKNCDVKLLNAKSLSAETTTANEDNLSHLQEVPLLYKHKGKLVLLSASSCVQNIIKKKKKDGIKIDDQALAIAYSECGESSSLKSSFKTCTCSSNQNKMADGESLEKENNELKAKLKAIEDEKEKEKSYESKKARYAKLFAQTDDEDREKMIARMSESEEDKDELKAMSEVHSELKSKKAKDDDPEKEDLKARLKAIEDEKKEEKMKAMVALQAKYGLSNKEQNEYYASLKAKSYNEIMSKYEDVEPIIKSMKASTISDTEKDFIWNGGDITSLRGKTFDEIMEVSS